MPVYAIQQKQFGTIHFISPLLLIIIHSIERKKKKNIVFNITYVMHIVNDHILIFFCNVCNKKYTNYDDYFYPHLFNLTWFLYAKMEFLNQILNPIPICQDYKNDTHRYVSDAVQHFYIFRTQLYTNTQILRYFTISLPQAEKLSKILYNS